MGPPLAGEPRGYDVIRIPGGKRNDELLTDEDEDGDVGWLEGELDADRDYAYRVVAVDDDGRHAVTGVARAADTNDGPQRAAATLTGVRRPRWRSRAWTLGEARDPRPALLRALAAADAFRLRTGLTWLLMTASFGLTLALTYFLYLGGLPRCRCSRSGSWSRTATCCGARSARVEVRDGLKPVPLVRDGI